MKLSPSLSAYLDFMRFGAALTVLFGHMGQDGFDISWMPLGYLSHEAVIVFFVMSGFIIYQSTAGRGGSAWDYVVARASRVYSVAVPAVVFSVVFSLLLARYVADPRAVAPSYRAFSLLDIAGSLLFVNESWSSLKASTQLTLNGPYWSLCYEVWYYVIFGVFFFAKGRWRWPLVALACLLAGPQILVLFPLWCLGAWLAAHGDAGPKLSRGVAWLVFLAAPVLAIAINAAHLDQLIKSALHNAIPGFWRLEASQRLVTDYVLGIAVAAHIHAYPYLGEPVQRFFERWRAPLASLAGFSFTLYLFHRPLTDVIGALIPPQSQTVALSVAASFGFVLVCWLASFVSERQLPRWRRALRRLLPAGGAAPATITVPADAAAPSKS